MTRSTRYEEVSRRAFLRRSAAAGAVILFPGLAACAGDSPSTFAATSTTTTSPATTSTTDATTTTTSVSSTTEAPPTTFADALIPAGAEMLVAFSYVAGESRERINNPYVAAWIEDADGELVKTLALWYMKTDKGKEWLADLFRWNRVDGSAYTIVSVSSATRTPGDYALVWDGTDLDDQKVMQGEYFVCVEAAREHGPHSLVRDPIVVGSDPFQMDLEPDGEIVAASVRMEVA